MRPRENPFRVECLEALSYRFQSGDLETLLQALALNRQRGAIIGPHGHGKSTLLSLLEGTLLQKGTSVRSLRLTESNRKKQSELVQEWLGPSGLSDMLLLDGAEQLTCWNWIKVLQHSRSCRGLVITSHRSGLLPTVYRCETNLELLEDLVRQLTEKSLACHVDPARLRQLFEFHRGNVRNCLRSLYDDAFSV